MDRSRRNFVLLAGAVPFAALASTIARAAGTSCYDPNSLTLSQRNQRRSISFVENSGDPKKRCGRCAFFQSRDGHCGTCDLMSGAPVTANGVCTSFADRG